MSHQSLEGALAAAGSPVEFLRHNTGRHPYPVPKEHTNWIEETRSWQETCCLSDLSHHQKDLYVEGPDALSVFADLGVNDFDDFQPGQAKQFVAANPDGDLIGDAILFYLDDRRLKLRGTPVAPTGSSTTSRRGRTTPRRRPTSATTTRTNPTERSGTSSRGRTRSTSCERSRTAPFRRSPFLTSMT